MVEMFLNCNECYQKFMTKRDLKNHESFHYRMNTTQLNKTQLKYAKFCTDTKVLSSLQDIKMITFTANNDFDQNLAKGYAIKERKNIIIMERKRVAQRIYLNKVKSIN